MPTTTQQESLVNACMQTFAESPSNLAPSITDNIRRELSRLCGQCRLIKIATGVVMKAASRHFFYAAAAILQFQVLAQSAAINIGNGDGYSAAQSQLSNPTGVALDTSGNIYIADNGNGLIRKISPDGVIHSVARDVLPYRLTTDRDGSVLFTDGVASIKRLFPNGKVDIVAGNGTSGFSGDGGAAKDAQIDTPAGIAIGRDHYLYFSDKGNSCVRKISPKGKIFISAGMPAAGANNKKEDGNHVPLGSPDGIMFDSKGNMFIIDARNLNVTIIGINHKTRLISLTLDRQVEAQAGSKSTTTLKYLAGAAMDATGNIYVADVVGNAVFKINPVGDVERWVGSGRAGYAGDGGAAKQAELNHPLDIAIDANGNIYIADSGNNRIRKVTPDGIINTVAGGGTGYLR